MLAFSSDGKSLVAGCSNQPITFWDTGTWRVTNTLQHTGTLYCLAVSPDFKTSAIKDDRARVLDVSTGQDIEALNPIVKDALQGANGVPGFAFSRDGRSLVVLGSYPLLIDTSSWKVVRRLHGGEGESGQMSQVVVFSSDGKSLVMGTQIPVGKSKILMLNLPPESRPPSRVFAEDPAHIITMVRFAADGKSLQTAASDGYSRAWDTDTLRKLTEEKVPGMEAPRTAWGDMALPSNQASVKGDCVRSPDGKWLAFPLKDGGVRFWDIKQHKVAQLLQEHKELAYSIAFSPDGQTMATSDTKGANNTEVHVLRIWSLSSGHILKLFQSEYEYDMQFSPDGKTIAMWRQASPGNRPIRNVSFVDTTTWKENYSVKTVDSPRDVAFSPDGKHVAVSDVYDCVWICNAQTGEKLYNLNVLGSALRFSPNSKQLAVYKRNRRYNDEISVWQVDSGKLSDFLLLKSGTLRTMEWSPDSRQLAAGGTMLQLWSLSE
jgi:WD40 repeat protein